MTLPTDVPMGYVTGTYIDPTGTAAEGSVIFTPSPAVLLDGASTPPVTVLPRPVTAHVIGGSLTQELVATDSTDLDPSGWTYLVTHQLRYGNIGVTIPSFSINVPQGDVDAAVDLTTVSPVGPSGGVTTFGELVAAAEAAVASVAYATWQATTAYGSGQTVQAPDGTLIKSSSTRTSRASFDGTEQGNWTPVATKTGTLEQVALDARYLTQSGIDAAVAAKVNDTTPSASRSAVQSAVSAFTVWQPTTAYVSGQTIQAPDGSLIKANSSRTSRASFDTTEQGNWTPVATKSGTIERVALDATYAKRIYLNLTDYGAIGAADDATTVNAALAAANALSNRANGEGYLGVTILIPGQVNLPHGTTQRITSDGIFLESAAPGQAVIQVTDGTAFTWGTGGTGLMKSGGTRGLKFAAGPLGVTSAQVCHDIDYGSELTFYDTKVAKIATLVRAGEAATTRVCAGVTVNGVKGSAANVAAPFFDLRYGTGFYLDDCTVYVSGVGYPANTTDTHANVGTSGAFANGSGTGVYPGRDFIAVTNGSWDTIKVGDQVITNRFDRGLNVLAASGVVIGNIFLAEPTFDYCANNAVLLRSTGGTISKVRCLGGYLVATDGHCVYGTATGGSIRNVKFIGTWALYAGQNNYRFEATATSDISLVDCVGRGANRLAATNTTDQQDGTVMLGSDWSIIGGQHGIDGSPDTGFANQGRFGLTVQATSDRYRVIGPVLDGTSGAQSNLQAHTSNGLARSVKGVTTKSGVRLNGTTTAPFAIAATGGNMTNNLGFTVVMYVSGGTVTAISVNGVTTGLTSGAITLAPGDTWAISYSVAPTVNRQILAA